MVVVATSVWAPRRAEQNGERGLDDVCALARSKAQVWVAAGEEPWASASSAHMPFIHQHARTMHASLSARMACQLRGSGGSRLEQDKRAPRQPL